MAFTAACTLGVLAAGGTLTDQQSRIGLASAATVVGGTSGINSRSGIKPGNGTPLGVVQIPTPSMNVRVSPGTAYVQSSVTNGGVFTATLEAQTDIQVNASVANPRIDVLVVHVSHTGTSPSAQLEWVQGTAAASPTRPALPVTTNHSYFPVAQVTVPGSASTIVTANITLTAADGLFSAAVGGVVPVTSSATASTLPEGTPFYAQNVDKLGVKTAAGTEMYRKDFLVAQGKTTATTGAGGDVTVSHNLGVTPTSVHATIASGGTAGISVIGKLIDNGSSTTQTQFLLVRTDNGAVIGSNSVVFNWICFGAF